MSKGKLKKFIDLFNQNCAMRGHFWSDLPFEDGHQYCQACGATRKKPDES